MRGVMKRNTSSLPIGVFDSGMGGLTVLRELKKSLVNESFLYLGDTARLPYGTKSQETVVRYAMQMAELLIAKGIKLLVIACNTATMAALDALKKHYPNLPIIGVIEPGANAAIKAAQTKKNILVLATEATIRSNIYSNFIAVHEPDISVNGLACGLFVALVEEGFVNDEVAHVVVNKYLSNLDVTEFDSVLLGCTHFPVLKPIIQKYMGATVTIVDSAIETAKAVKAALTQADIQSKTPSASICFLVTDLPERFIRVGLLFLQERITMKDVEVVNI
tara:strand:+ start:143 stop:973 length:831 start_codon:yes stop_codon:yes gene_type:complete